MSAAHRLPHPVELVNLRRISPTLASVNVRLPDVHLIGFRVELVTPGMLRITPPTISDDETGGHRPAFYLQPGTREAVEQAICLVWERAP